MSENVDKRLMKYLILLSLLFHNLFFSLSLAQEIGSSNQLFSKVQSELDLKLKLNSIVMEVSHEIDRENSHKTAREVLEDKNDLSKILKKHSATFINFYRDNLKVPDGKKSIFVKAFNRLKWDRIVEIVPKVHLGIHTFFRKHGFGVAIAFILSSILKLD